MATLSPDRQRIRNRKEKAKAITPNDIEAAHIAAQDAFRLAYCEQDFKSGTETLSMCYPGRICRGQQLLTDFAGKPQEKDIRKGYGSLVKEAEQAGTVFKQAVERYHDLCERAGKKPELISEPCNCAYCLFEEEESRLASISHALANLKEERTEDAARALIDRAEYYVQMKMEMEP